MVALCMMYVYLYLLVYGWLCTLYDGLLWLCERPFLVMSALDLIVSCTLMGHTLGVWQCLVYFLVLCDSIVHDACFIYIYICLLVCGWFYTLYGGLLWLCERPFLVMSALDLIVWVCAQGNCCRCIFMLYCVHDHRGVIVLIHVNKWHWFPCVCDMYQYVLTLWRALACYNASMSICDVYTDAKPCDAL